MPDKIQNTFDVKGVGATDTTIITINDLIVFAFGLDGLKRFQSRINERVAFLELKARIDAESARKAD